MWRRSRRREGRRPVDRAPTTSPKHRSQPCAAEPLRLGPAMRNRRPRRASGLLGQAEEPLKHWCSLSVQPRLAPVDQPPKPGRARGGVDLNRAGRRSRAGRRAGADRDSAPSRRRRVPHLSRSRGICHLPLVHGGRVHGYLRATATTPGSRSRRVAIRTAGRLPRQQRTERGPRYRLALTKRQPRLPAQASGSLPTP